MYLTATAQAPARAARSRFSFVAKILVAGMLVAIADLLLWEGGGSAFGAFAGLLLLAACMVRPALGRTRASLVAVAIGLFFATALFVEPSLLGVILFWTAASLTALLPRAALDDGWRWAQRLGLQTMATPLLPFRDLRRLRRVGRQRPRPRGAPTLPMVALPLIGSIVFVTLFARANPLIGDAFAAVAWGRVFGGASLGRMLFWAAMTVAVWSLLRPAMVRLRGRREAGQASALPGVNPVSVTLSLLAFNLIFAVQNGLDIAFLWSGAPLPEGMTLADYAHRGAYPLIVTALLAALFVLLTLRPGSAMAESAQLRRLVSLWIAQNVLLVASTMLRTVDYVEAYSLTILRISALLWMALVAIGLILICWRLWRSRSAAWLINANMAAALLLLGACAWIDLGATSAWWNVGHARESGGAGASLDLCYLDRLGEAALLPVIALESRSAGAPRLRDRLAWLRAEKMATLAAQQAHWRTWTLRGAHRLGEARAAIVRHRLPPVRREARACGGVPLALTAPPAR